MLNNHHALEERIGYTFQNQKLLETSLTHSSYVAEHDKPYWYNNERLEFLGDAYLDAIIGRKLFAMMPEDKEGVLSKTRADVVCERSLAEIARSMELGDHLRLGHGEEMGGGRKKDSILADATEALIGALLLDAGYEATEKIVLRLFRERIRKAVKGELYRDYKTVLQERIQAKYHSVTILYEIIEESGPDHDKQFVAQVSVHGEKLGTGSGRSKKEAEQNAAKAVLEAKGVL